MSHDSEHEHARVADEARQRAGEADARARAEAERIAAGARTGGEDLRQSGVIYGGLIAVAVAMPSRWTATRKKLLRPFDVPRRCGTGRRERAGMSLESVAAEAFRR